MATKKVQKVRNRWSICYGEVKSRVPLFSVPNTISTGIIDIRVFYDTTKCELNMTLWALIFNLTTVDSTLRLIEKKYSESEQRIFIMNALNSKERLNPGTDYVKM